jgi:hypothetical protein
MVHELLIQFLCQSSLLKLRSKTTVNALGKKKPSFPSSYIFNFYAKQKTQNVIWV